jgi:crossover junction endodeoxyribonuclease RuvC
MDDRRASMPESLTIMGIDPGSRATGFGLVRVDGPRIGYISSGVIRLKGDDFADRLRLIFDQMSVLLNEHRPREVAIERVFMHRNADSALKLGQARAAAICATFARPVPVHEYAAREVKQAVTGTGAAEKEQVQMMVKRLLGLQGRLQADAADALAVALCHAHMRTVRGLTAEEMMGKKRK